MSPTASAADHRARSGVSAVAASFFIWGLLPLYLKPLATVPALQIAGWRYLMGCAVVTGWIAWRGELSDVRRAFASSALLGRLVVTASLLAVNWILYAWGVGHHQVLLTSLGYFINPLVNVLLGVLVLSERLNRVQWTAVTLAAGGVLTLTAQTGEPPWIALALAATFGLYGLLRKTAAAAPLTGLAVETLLMGPLAGAYLLFANTHNDSIHYTPLMMVLLAGSGVMTIVPLTLFNYGAQRINYATVGMLQYIGPTLQFLCGIFIFKETLSPAKLLSFILIWLALVVYAGDSLWRSRSLRYLQSP